MKKLILIFIICFCYLFGFGQNDEPYTQLYKGGGSLHYRLTKVKDIWYFEIIIEKLTIKSIKKDSELEFKCKNDSTYKIKCFYDGIAKIQNGEAGYCIGYRVGITTAYLLTETVINGLKTNYIKLIRISTDKEIIERDISKENAKNLLKLLNQL